MKIYGQSIVDFEKKKIRTEENNPIFKSSGPFHGIGRTINVWGLPSLYWTRKGTKPDFSFVHLSVVGLRGPSYKVFLWVEGLFEN